MNVFSWLVTYVFSFGVATDPGSVVDPVLFLVIGESIGSGMPFGKGGRGFPAPGFCVTLPTGATVRCRKQAPQEAVRVKRTENPG